MHLTQDSTALNLIARAHRLGEGRYGGSWGQQAARDVQALEVIESERAILHAKDMAAAKKRRNRR